jgi:hypothetical protein
VSSELSVDIVLFVEIDNEEVVNELLFVEVVSENDITGEVIFVQNVLNC